jgi:hypothetical protein
MSLKLGNKHMNTERIIDGLYEPHINDVLGVRIESLFHANELSNYKFNDTGKEKAIYLAWSMMTDTIDLKVADKVHIRNLNKKKDGADSNDPGKKLVVVGIREAQDREFAHMEVLLRELDSQFHEEITIKNPAPLEQQTNFDPIFKQWVNSKNYNDTVTNVIIDYVKPGIFVDLQAAGLIKEAEYIVTVDLPIIPTLEDKLEIHGKKYYIEHIEKMPYQTLCMITKIKPKGKQF